MASEEMPQPPYVLLFEEVEPDAQPFAVLVGDRAAVPLFDAEAKAAAFVDSTDFGTKPEPVEVTGAGLVRALVSIEDEVDYVALNPPPAGEGGVRVRMGSLAELIAALETSGRGDDLFNLGGGR